MTFIAKCYVVLLWVTLLGLAVYWLFRLVEVVL
jgi:hypothetical protein